MTRWSKIPKEMVHLIDDFGTAEPQTATRLMGNLTGEDTRRARRHICGRWVKGTHRPGPHQAYLITSLRTGGKLKEWSFHSISEARHFDVLLARLHAGEIERLHLQPLFRLQDGFTHEATGNKVKAVNYRADFWYRDLSDRRWHCEDVKGKLTDASSLRGKWFMLTHPRFYYELVDASQYHEKPKRRKRR